MKEKMGILITIDYATVEKQYACIVSFANSNTFSLVVLQIYSQHPDKKNTILHFILKGKIL